MFQFKKIHIIPASPSFVMPIKKWSPTVVCRFCIISRILICITHFSFICFSIYFMIYLLWLLYWKGLKHMLRKILTFFHKETVLSISAILATLSMFIVHPSGKYFSYIDFRTLSLLFCLMSIVAGLSEIGLFDYLAEKILSRANSIKSIIVLLVLLCFLMLSCMRYL